MRFVLRIVIGGACILAFASLVQACASPASESGPAASSEDAEAAADVGSRAPADAGKHADVPWDSVLPVDTPGDSGTDGVSIGPDGHDSGPDAAVDVSDSQGVGADGDGGSVEPDGGPKDGGDSEPSDSPDTGAPPECAVDGECSNGTYCLAGSCVATKSCNKDADCDGDPLGPTCKGGTCGCKFAYAGWWGWGDSQWDDPCAPGRYCPPDGENCRSKCLSDGDCTLKPHNKCYGNGRCGCSSDPAKNQCELFCSVRDFGAVPGSYGLCEPCDAVYGYPSSGNHYWYSAVQRCKNGGDPAIWCKWIDDALCVGAACSPFICTSDSDCIGPKVPNKGMPQADLPLRCYQPLGRCAPSCKTLYDCPAIFTQCMKAPYCKKLSANDEWGFCGSWDDP